MIQDGKILIVDDQENILTFITCGLRYKYKETIALETAKSGEEALEKLKHFPANIVITDIKMPGMDGLTLLKKIKEYDQNIYVLIITGYGTIESTVKAIKEGAYDYIPKPFDLEELHLKIDRILKQEIFFQEKSLKQEKKNYRYMSIIGTSPKMADVYTMIDQVATSNATILITGESGTGKELVAEAIHCKSRRRNNPCIKLNCAALTEGLINSELFGHEKGSFTGAIIKKRGIFESANCGTVFLDEIGDMPISTQICLLRILETGTFIRVGGTETLMIDVRIICATNQNLLSKMKEGLFREDLFYRINVVSIKVPPLRERKSDIPLLVNWYLKKFCKENKKKIITISKSAMNILIQYNWPGNVRELINVIEYSVIFCKGNEIVPQCLPEDIKQNSEEKCPNINFSSRSLFSAESILIDTVLEENNWNIYQAAKALGISRATLYSKMKKYGKEKPSTEIPLE